MVFFFAGRGKLQLPRHGGAKCDGVIGAGARESARRIIISVTVGSWASRLEHLRVNRRLAGGG